MDLHIYHIGYSCVGRAGCTVVSKFYETELANDVKTIIVSEYSSTLKEHEADVKLHIPGVEGFLHPGLTTVPGREGALRSTIRLLKH